MTTIDWNGKLSTRDGRPARYLGPLKGGFHAAAVESNGSETVWCLSCSTTYIINVPTPPPERWEAYDRASWPMAARFVRFTSDEHDFYAVLGGNALGVWVFIEDVQEHWKWQGLLTDCELSRDGVTWERAARKVKA